MSSVTEDPLAMARAALADGDWTAARAGFEAGLERGPSAEASQGLGTALWWLGETDAAVRRHADAYAQFRRRPEPVPAAMSAISLCLLYRASLGNYAASRGWMQRLARLVEEFGLQPLTGWVSLCRAVTANDASEPSAAETWAREAAAAGRDACDADLELCALTELGWALVQTGRTGHGVALLDEAMAGALAGETLHPESIVFVGCRTIESCRRVADVQRAVEWVRAADGFTRRYGGLHLYTMCRVQYGILLFGTGRWAEAEHELLTGLRAGKHAERSLYGEALAALAQLRLAQGRVSEATGLLAGFEDHVAASAVLAGVHLARGEPAVAADLLHRRLDGVAEPCLDTVALIELLCEAELGLGQVDLATSRARDLAALGVGSGCELVVACGQRALGGTLAASSDGDSAVVHLRRALQGFASLGMPFESSRTHAMLARVLSERDPEVAVAHARLALSGFERLEAAPGADAAAALLRSLGVKASRGGPSGTDALTRREQEVLALLGEGLSNRQLADRLVLSRKTVEHHVASVLAKLGLRSRAEAAAVAVRHPGTGPPPDAGTNRVGTEPTPRQAGGDEGGQGRAS